MDCLSGAWSIVPSLWECSAKHAKYIGDLEDNLESLRSEMLKLKNLSKDVRNQVGEAEEQQKRVRHQVNGWLESVEAAENEVNLIVQKGEQELGNRCVGSCCPNNCRSSYKIGKSVLKMIPRVKELAGGGQFDIIADELPPPPVDELLAENLASLKSAMVKLENLSKDVRNRVKEDEDQHMKRTNQVNGWLESVEAVEKEVNQILQKGNEELGNRCVGSSCPKNSESGYKLLEDVMMMISQVTILTTEGKFNVVAHQLPPPPVDEQPLNNVVVGSESKFEEVWRSFQNNDYPVIGLVGMGGVGKTTLLKQLNNELLKAVHGYDLVIWIMVSKPVNIGRSQEIIRDKLNIQDHLWVNKSEDQRASLIFNQLKKKKFVVLLDDVWERLEFSKVGIPQPSLDNKSKVVLSTRSQKVCWSMDAHKVVEVDCLPQDPAFNLFCSMVGEDVFKCHPEIKRLVEDVARECQGLPLALVTIGRAMRGKKDAQKWKDAKRALEKYPSTFSDMEGRVFFKLVFSYDNLPTPTHRKCFEYCSLYPEDHNIAEKKIIKLWLAQGLRHDYDSMYDALVRGRQIIESLKQACLLQ